MCAGADFGRPCIGHERQIAGARVGEIQNFGTVQVSETDGKPVKPHLKTLNVNLVGAIYSKSFFHFSNVCCFSNLRKFTLSPATQLALHYLPKTRNPTAPLKYIVFLGFFGMSSRRALVLFG